MLPAIVRRAFSTTRTLDRVTADLQMAVDASRCIASSANLAFLERDPSDRPPRAHFVVDACNASNALLHRSILNARALLQSRAQSQSELSHAQSLALTDLMVVAEHRALEIDAHIQTTLRYIHKLHSSA
ncbi:unnamed protein product [Agarophyton chilense]